MKTILFTALSLLIFIGKASAETWICNAFMGYRIGTIVIDYTEEPKGTANWSPADLLVALNAPSGSGEAVKNGTDEFTMWKFPNGDAWDCERQSGSSQWYCTYFGNRGVFPQMKLHCNEIMTSRGIDEQLCVSNVYYKFVFIDKQSNFCSILDNYSAEIELGVELEVTFQNSHGHTVQDNKY